MTAQPLRMVDGVIISESNRKGTAELAAESRIETLEARDGVFRSIILLLFIAAVLSIALNVALLCRLARLVALLEVQ